MSCRRVETGLTDDLLRRSNNYNSFVQKICAIAPRRRHTRANPIIGHWQAAGGPENAPEEYFR